MDFPWRPTKDKGQNFLVDGNLARKFVTTLDPQSDDVVLEIGPGKGALTEPLLATGCRVVAVEIEAGLVEELEAHEWERLEVIQADFLKLRLEELKEQIGPVPGRLLALSNVPYSITGPVLARLFSGVLPVERFVVGLQLEVADRLVAPEGSRTYGRLSVVGAAWGKLKRSFKLPPQAYRPRPKVMSAAVLGIRDAEKAPCYPGSDLDRTLRASFGQRRKTLGNAIASGLHVDKAQVQESLARVDINASLRAEAISLEGYRRMAEALRQDGLFESLENLQNNHQTRPEKIP